MRLVSPQIIRSDSEGDGHFGAGRIGHIHKGVDFVVSPGQSIKAPENGYLKRQANPDPNDSRKHGFLFVGDSGIETKVFYADTVVPIGTQLKKGDKIAEAQSVSALYNLPDMKDHIHVETRKGGVLIDPMTVFTDGEKKNYNPNCDCCSCNIDYTLLAAEVLKQIKEKL